MTLPDTRRQTIEVSKTCRCSDLLETLAKSVGIQQYNDFKIFVRVDGVERVVDDNEVIFKIIKNYNISSKLLYYKNRKHREIHQ